MSCDLTPGLYSLIFLSKPENYNDQDLKMFKKIILETNIHRVGFQPNNRNKGTQAYKYSHIIEKKTNVSVLQCLLHFAQNWFWLHDS